MKNKIVLVEWFDAESSDCWDDINSLVNFDLPLIETFGILLKETNKGLVIAQNFDATNNKASMIMKIPKGMIKKVSKLKKA